MSLAAGKLRHRIVIERVVETQDVNTGAINVVWIEFTTVWASIQDLSAKELIAAQAEASKITTKIIVRQRSSIVSKMRLYHAAKDTYYNIEGIMDDSQSGLEYMTILCSKGVRFM